VVLSVKLNTNKTLHQQAGPLLFTHFGVSGPAAMDISRHLTATRREHGETNVQLVANLVPAHTAESLDKQLLALTQSQPRRTVLHVAEQYLPARLAASILKQSVCLPGDMPLSQLPKEGRRSLVQGLTALPLPVTGDRGYDHAEVTAGGVPLSEVETMTMRSRVCDGLYLAGELLDVDGRIGGYNFQWAWCTGRLAGLAAARSLGR
jgi:predicted Rossmann fold flavoprotein